HPRQDELARRDALLGGELLDPLDELEVLLEVNSLEAWALTAKIVLVEILGGAKPSREEPAPEGAVGDEADAELAHRRQHLVLWIACPQRVLRLECRDRVYGVPAADRLGRRL